MHVTAAAGRNRAFGDGVGRGKPPSQVAAEMAAAGQLTEGYAAIATRWDAKGDALALLGAIDPARELERFKAGEHPSVEGLEFDIRYTLTDISGLYAEEKAAYDAKEAAEQAARRRKAEADRAASARRRGIVEALSTYGITAKDNAAGKIELSLDEAEKLLDKVRELEG